MKDYERTALLIGVGDNPGAEDRLPALGATVEADLRVMSGALRGSGYTVESLRDPTRNEIAERITALSSSAAAGSTLLVYFTGHGVRIGSTDYLVPADALAPPVSAEGAGALGVGGSSRMSGSPCWTPTSASIWSTAVPTPCCG